MRGAVTSHDGHILLREDRSTRAQNWVSRRGAFTFRQEKIKRFASSGISGHSRSGRTQAKLNGWGGMSFGPLRCDRRPVQVFTFTSCDSKNYDCLQPPVGKVLAFMLCRLTDVCHAPSEPPAKRTLADGGLTWTRAKCGRPPMCMTVMDGVPDKKLVVVDHQLRKKHSRCSRRKSSITAVQWRVARLVVVVKGSGVDDWFCMKLVWVFKYILVHVNIGVPIKLFFVRKSGGGGGGGVKANSSGIRILKNFKNYGRPLSDIPRLTGFPVCVNGPLKQYFFAFTQPFGFVCWELPSSKLEKDKEV